MTNVRSIWVPCRRIREYILFLTIKKIRREGDFYKVRRRRASVRKSSPKKGTLLPCLFYKLHFVWRSLKCLRIPLSCQSAFLVITSLWLFGAWVFPYLIHGLFTVSVLPFIVFTQNRTTLEVNLTFVLWFCSFFNKDLENKSDKTPIFGYRKNSPSVT